MAAIKKVLVVDDEIHIAHRIAIKLRRNGYDVITAENGADALISAMKEKPDIVITDYQMPIMTGLELVGEMRKREKTKDIPVIMLTDKSLTPPQEQQDELQISKCMSKPFDPTELLRNIEDILRK